MHENSMRLVKKHLDRFPTIYTPPSIKVLDVGSYDMNGSYRELIRSLGYQYTGLDIRPGPNVDIVSTAPLAWPIENQTYHIVICGNMLHSVDDLRTWSFEVTRVLKEGGLLIVVAGTWNKGPTSKTPGDYWRIMPDGLEYLFRQTYTMEIESIRIETSEMDVCGSAFKMEDPR
jgi:2-polyprenyl-3-methyl-5-hydroxy-6-metoxy-1,4-benzoquinol methylase